MTTPFPFVAAQVLTASELNSITNLPSSTKTTSYTFTVANAGGRVIMNAAGSTTLTVNTSIFSAGDVVEISNIGAGVCTVTAGTATVSSAGPLAVPQYGGGRLVFTSASAAIYYPSAVTVAAPAASGLTFISTTNLSGNQTNITNCFSTTYTHYEVRFSNFACGGVINMRYGTSGTPDTGSNYCNYQLYVDSSSVGQGGYRFDDTSHCLISNGSAVRGNSLFLSVSSPFESVKTTFAVNACGTSGANSFGSLSSGLVNTSTSYTDLVLVFPSGPVTSGTVSIYGLAKA